MNGLSRRGDSSCRLRAISSLPAPVSPLMSTDASVGATFAISRRTCSIAGLRPMMRGATTFCPASSRRSAWFSSTSSRRSSARRTVSISRSAANGFSMKS